MVAAMVIRKTHTTTTRCMARRRITMEAEEDITHTVVVGITDATGHLDCFAGC